MPLIVFHDAKCPLCVGWIKFLLDRDGHDRLRFASLQSEWTRQFFQEQGLEHPGMESIVVWDGMALRTHSEAILTILEALPGVWQLGKHLRVVPTRLRTSSYTFVARRRYDMFGQYDECWIPKQADRVKFMDLSPESRVQSPKSE